MTYSSGIDIRGGVSAILEPDIAKAHFRIKIDKGLESAKTILGKRLDAKIYLIEV